MSKMQFIVDLQSQRDRMGDSLSRAMDAVLEHGQFINGPEVEKFEKALAAFTGAKHVIGCANGTDAMTLVCMAESIGAGDAVFVPAFTFVATAEAPAQLGATPVFVDVDAATFNMSAGSLERAIGESKQQGFKPRMIIAVDLFGQPADYAALRVVAEKHGLVLVVDAAQAMGASLNDKRIGSGALADYITTSFFPTKPLACFGDGGAVLTDDDEKAALVCSIAAHGKGTHKYENVRVGINSRLDTLQAAVLLAKLEIFEDELAARSAIATRYNAALAPLESVTIPAVIADAEPAWALYTVQSDDRDALKAKLDKAGIPSGVYYPAPLNRQPGYAAFPTDSEGLAVSEALCTRVLSLPMQPYLSDADIDAVVVAITA